MERSTAHLLSKRGKSIRRIAEELGRSPTTIAKVLKEPVDREPAPRHRRSGLDPWRPQIQGWLREGLSVVRMLELARGDPDEPYTGSRSHFGEYVRRMRREQQQQASADVPIRFEGMPAEYLQVDWGEVRNFPFTQRASSRRYFLACRLKYSRWVWVRWTTDMRQETLLRGLVDCFLELGWVPWVLVFDNMKTVTSGRDSSRQPVWTPALLQLAGEFGFHPQACDPGAANQKGSVESLVKWVKGNLLPGRSFADDADLGEQTTEWREYANARPSSATGVPPIKRLAEEAVQGSVLPPTARDYGLMESRHVSPEALVAVGGSRYSVPVAHVGAPVTVRLHPDRVRVWRDTECIADHPRRPDGARGRVVEPVHFEPVLGRKPRARAMLYREVLAGLGGHAPEYLSELSRRRRDRLGKEILGVWTLYERHGAEQLLAAMALSGDAGAYGADALALLLSSPSGRSARVSELALPGVPTQSEIDRQLAAYEAWVRVDVSLEEVAR